MRLSIAETSTHRQSITSSQDECLLGYGVKPTQADSKIEEEHLSNFVVNSLDKELAVYLDENVEVTTETLHEVRAGASVGGISINHVCETTDNSPHANSVCGHLKDLFELDSVEEIGGCSCNEIPLRHSRINRLR